MLLNIYRSNAQLTALGIPIAAAILQFPFFLGVESVDPPVSTALSTYVNSLLLGYGWLEGILAIVLISVQAFLLNRLFLKHEFTERGSMLTAYLFVFLASILPGELGVHPVLFANLFLILALHRTLAIYRQINVASELFDSGFLIGVAALFYLPALLVLPFIWFGASMLRTSGWRDYVVPWLGLLTPLLFLAVGYYWIGEWPVLDAYISDFSYAPKVVFSEQSVLNYIVVGLAVLTGLLTTLAVARNISGSVMRSKQVKKVFLAFSVFTLLVFGFALFQPEQGFSFALLAIPLAVFWSIFLQAVQQRWLADLLYYLLLACVGVNYFFIILG